MTRNTLGNIGATMFALWFYALCLYLFRGSADGKASNAALMWALLATGAVMGLVWAIILVLRRFGAKS